jgi:transcriptional regulator with PAS, ATPase and Fis domain
MEVLLNHDYPGNVRELENILEHALIICRGRVIRRKHLPVSMLRENAASTVEPSRGAADAVDLETGLAAAERERILSALKAHHWSRSKAAAALRIDRTTLWRKMKKYDIVQ